jgi:Protein of unknown function (DUF2752)
MKKKWSLATVLLLAIFCAVFHFRYTIMALMPFCLFHKLTGLYCPGCGGRRCIAALGRGEMIEALHNNALLLLGGFFIIFSIWRQIYQEWRADSTRLIDISSRTGWLIGVIILSFFIFRNIPLWPFSILAPLD